MNSKINLGIDIDVGLHLEEAKEKITTLCKKIISERINYFFGENRHFYYDSKQGKNVTEVIKGEGVKEIDEFICNKFVDPKFQAHINAYFDEHWEEIFAKCMEQPFQEEKEKQVNLCKNLVASCFVHGKQKEGMLTTAEASHRAMKDGTTITISSDTRKIFFFTDDHLFGYRYLPKDFVPVTRVVTTNTLPMENFITMYEKGRRQINSIDELVAILASDVEN